MLVPRPRGEPHLEPWSGAAAERSSMVVMIICNTTPAQRRTQQESGWYIVHRAVVRGCRVLPGMMAGLSSFTPYYVNPEEEIKIASPFKICISTDCSNFDNIDCNKAVDLSIDPAASTCLAQPDMPS